MDDSSARDQLIALLSGYRLTEIVIVAARLGIADVLAAGPRGVGALAAETGTHAPTLRRLLRALAAARIIDEDEAGLFNLTALGARLRSDRPDSLRDWAIFVGRPYHRQLWAGLERAVRTGQNEFTAQHGEDIWTWRSHEPEEDELFNRAMVSLTAGTGAALALAYPFGDHRVVADIGGGTGGLLADVLTHHIALQGVLFDAPHVVAQAGPILTAAGVADRVKVVGGDFFRAVPKADAYVVKSILHDWSDADARRIVDRISEASPDRDPLLVVESVVGPPSEGVAVALSDLQMLLGPGGRERTLDEWRAVVEPAGYELTDVRPLVGTTRLLVFRRSDRARAAS